MLIVWCHWLPSKTSSSSSFSMLITYGQNPAQVRLYCSISDIIMNLSLFAYRAASEFLEACPSEMIINAVVSVYWATHLFQMVMRPVNASGRMYQPFFSSGRHEVHRKHCAYMWWDYYMIWFWTWFQRWQHHRFEGHMSLSLRCLDMRIVAFGYASLFRHVCVWA